jgi:tetraprenyl-beta-curcumene synthase
MSHRRTRDPTPLTPAQIRALVAAAGRELVWGLRNVGRELRRWRRRAERIPDDVIRGDALDALDHKRTNTDGAAVFATLLDGRNVELLLLLAVYQAIWDFLDSLGERHPTEANGRELHLALVDALQPGVPLADYYRYHPWRDDGGYLVELVESCRERCEALPSYEVVRPLVVREAWRAQVQALNHLPDRRTRDGALRRWAELEFRGRQEVEWFELTAAASASLVILPLLALSADPAVGQRDVTATYAVYWPWVSLATTMLDNYADQDEDVSNGNHNYFTHYGDPAFGTSRLRGHIERATAGARGLPHGARHAVIVSAMVAMYISKDCDGSAGTRRARRELARAGGSLVRLLVPVLRAWRIAYGQRST